MLRSALFVSVLAAGGTAFANPASIVPGGSDPDKADADFAQKSVDVYAEVDYSYDLSTSTIARERIGTGSDPTGGIPQVRDLDFTQFRHTITPRLHVGIFRDTFLSVALPIVITQVRELELSEGVTRASSSTVAEGLVSADGFDARDPSVATTGSLLFRGPSRKGVDQIHLGLGVAPMNQQKDPTKPTWKLGGEVRLAIGETMSFDPTDVGGNDGVSPGVHELRLWTTFARKIGRVEPWVEMFWQVPLIEREGSLYDDPGFGSTSVTKSQQAGIGFGLELYALDNRADQTRISIDLGTRVVGHFEGREYTEMWEVFAYAGESRGMGPLILDSDPTRADVQALSHPGISNVENYLESTGRFAVRAQIGPHVRFAVGADVVWKTDHAISFADAGVDEDGNDLVDPGTAEVNPLHESSIDLVGHRYLSHDNFDVVLNVQGQVLF